MSEQFEQDDREALARTIYGEIAFRGGEDEHYEAVRGGMYHKAADAVLAAGFRRSPEPQQVAEYEYGLLNPDSCTGEPHLYSTNREHIEREHRRGHPANQIVRRVKAGPWERVPDTEGSAE